MRAFAIAGCLGYALLSARAAQAQCYELVDVTCPIRNEISIGVGPTTEKLAVAIAWTSTKRVGLYVRFFPGLDPEEPPRVNSTITTQSASEFGLTYRLLTPLTVGVGYGRFEETVSSYGALDPFTFRPILADRETAFKKGPSLLVVYAFAPPRRPIGFSISVSAGAVGSGAAIGTTLRFPKGGATPGVK